MRRAASRPDRRRETHRTEGTVLGARLRIPCLRRKFFGFGRRFGVAPSSFIAVLGASPLGPAAGGGQRKTFNRQRLERFDGGKVVQPLSSGDKASAVNRGVWRPTWQADRAASWHAVQPIAKRNRQTSRPLPATASGDRCREVRAPKESLSTPAFLTRLSRFRASALLVSEQCSSRHRCKAGRRRPLLRRAFSAPNALAFVRDNESVNDEVTEIGTEAIGLTPLRRCGVGPLPAAFQGKAAH